VAGARDGIYAVAAGEAVWRSAMQNQVIPMEQLLHEPQPAHLT